MSPRFVATDQRLVCTTRAYPVWDLLASSSTMSDHSWTTEHQTKLVGRVRKKVAPAEWERDPQNSLIDARGVLVVHAPEWIQTDLAAFLRDQRQPR